MLTGVSVDIAPGQVVGVVGRSGSGKSTLTQLIQRMHMPTEGRVLVDGIDLATVDPASLRRQIGVVLQDMDLRSPVNGVVQQLAVHTTGGVVTAAQPLLAVVPDDGAIEVEARLANRDSGFVQAGQAAVVKVETFAFTRYGTLPGEVVSVSRDAVPDEQQGWVYSVRIRLHHTQMEVDGRRVTLSPGMAVSAEVLTGTRRVISYFLSPLMQHAQESLRER